MSVSASSLNGVSPPIVGRSASSQTNVEIQTAIELTNKRVEKLENLPSLSRNQRKTLIRLKLRMAILSQLSQFDAMGNVKITMYKGKRSKGQSQIDSIKIGRKEINLSKINLGKNANSALSQLYKIAPSDNMLKTCNVGLLFQDTNIDTSIGTSNNWFIYEDCIKDKKNNLIFFIPKNKVDSGSLVSSGGSEIKCIIPKREGNQFYQLAADFGRLGGGVHDSLDLSQDIKNNDELKARLKKYNVDNKNSYNEDLIFFVDKDKLTSSSYSFKKIDDLTDIEFVFKHYYIKLKGEKYAVVEKK